MTISTLRTNRSSRRAFTLAEVIVAAAISVFVLAGVLSAFVMIGRSGFAASSYSELEAQTRSALDLFGQDVRKATDVKWNSERSVTLFVALATRASTPVTYAYDPASGCFLRWLGDAESDLPRRVLIRNVAPDFAFHRFKLETASEPDTDAAATTDLETKQLEVTLRATRTGATTVATNQAARSARYILRNKRVTN
jgi:Tfp pilus assembly protein PilW